MYTGSLDSIVQYLSPKVFKTNQNIIVASSIINVETTGDDLLHI